MTKSKKVICVVTGKPNMFAGTYLAKKIEEFGNEEKLDKYYITKEVKALLKKGYKIKDVRKLLDVSEETNLPSPDVIQHLEDQYQKTAVKINDTNYQTLSTITNLTYDKSDEDVEFFITNHIMK